MFIDEEAIGEEDIQKSVESNQLNGQINSNSTDSSAPFVESPTRSSEAKVSPTATLIESTKNSPENTVNSAPPEEVKEVISTSPKKANLPSMAVSPFRRDTPEAVAQISSVGMNCKKLFKKNFLFCITTLILII